MNPVACTLKRWSSASFMCTQATTEKAKKILFEKCEVYLSILSTFPVEGNWSSWEMPHHHEYTLVRVKSVLHDGIFNLYYLSKGADKHGELSAQTA